LQKGFVSRDQAPKDEDMADMADYMRQLEAHDDLEAEVIKKTKVHKVLRAIIKLDNIPKEEEFNFKQRSTELLNKWAGALAADSDAGEKTTPATNGVKADDEKSESAKAETPAAEKKEEAKEETTGESKEESTEKNEEAPKTDAPAEPAAAEPADKDGDVSMADVEATKEAPAVIAAPNPDGAADAATKPDTEAAAPAATIS
jgi:predicted unusual protein kinase regulating ubiquinone biosynthesis (AarF/ABC1/UbiB family)